MGETSTEVDVIADAIGAIESDPAPEPAEAPKEEPKEVAKPAEPKLPEEGEKPEEKPTGLEEPKLPVDALTEESTEVDRLKNFRDKLIAAGLQNQAEQAERWYKQSQTREAENEELRAYKAERAKQEAEIAERRTKADNILADAPPDMKSAWGQYRQENGDRAFINAYKRHLEELRKESPDEYERQVASQERRKLAQDLERERAERERLEQDLAQREYLRERDSTLRSLQVDPADLEKMQDRVDGEYTVQYMKLQAAGKDAEALRIEEVAKQVIADQKAERARIKKQVEEELLEEARDTKKKKGTRRRAEEPVKPKGKRAADIDAAAEEEIRNAIVDSIEGK